MQHVCHVTEAVQAAVVIGIVVIGVLTHCALLHTVYDLKASQMNVPRSLIRELMLYEFKLKQPKIFVVHKGEGIVNPMVQKISLGFQ